MTADNPHDSPIPFTADDIRSFDFETIFSDFKFDAILSETKTRTCFAYERALTDTAKKLDGPDDEKPKAICSLFGYVCSFVLHLDTPHIPYSLRWVLNSIDIREPYAELLLEIVNDISDSELRARIADVLWVLRRGNYLTARLAIDSYLASAHVLEDPEHWVACAERIERALQLAAQIDRNGDYFRKTIRVVEVWLDKYNGNDPLFLSHKLMTMLIQYQQGDVKKYAVLSEKIALQAEVDHHWHKARQHWEIKALWHFRGGDEETAKQARLAAAETYVQEAADWVKGTPPNYSAAVHDLKYAMQGLRNYGGSQQRIVAVRQLLAEYQTKSKEELTHVSGKINVTEFVNKAVADVERKPLREAVLTLAEMGRPMPEAEIRRQVLKLKDQNAFYFFIHTEQLNAEGQTVASRPSAYSDGAEQVEQAIQAEMYRLSASYQGLQAFAVIFPALKQITLEHHIRYADLYEFTHNNPFIPPDREDIYLRGLYAGFSGDFLVASHLLIPQVENSVRVIFLHHGLITTNQDEQGIETKKDLGTLLYLPQSREILGDDLLFTLRGLLVERFGTNLRNRFAHGLDTSLLESAHSIYLWSLALFLCCSHTLAMQTTQQGNNDEDNDSREEGNQVQEQ